MCVQDVMVNCHVDISVTSLLLFVTNNVEQHSFAPLLELGYSTLFSFWGVWEDLNFAHPVGQLNVVLEY